MKHNTALTDFFEQNRKKLFAYLIKLSGEASEAEDIFQDTFIRYAEKYPDKQNPSLLFTVAKNIFLDSKRKYRFAEMQEGVEKTDENSPETILIGRQTQERLRKAMNKLLPAERELLAMAGPEGLKYDEIAKIAGLSAANVKVKIHRTRQKLKILLEENDG